MTAFSKTLDVTFSFIQIFFISNQSHFQGFMNLGKSNTVVHQFE